MTHNSEKNNITFFIDENDIEVNQHNNDFEYDKDEYSYNIDDDYLLQLDNLLDKYENTDFDLKVSQLIDYNINYTLKSLLAICDYYGISKNLKNLKANKEQIIEALVYFENDKNNLKVVSNRKKLWFYMNQLKKDKFMKKYIMLWN